MKRLPSNLTGILELRYKGDTPEMEDTIKLLEAICAHHRADCALNFDPVTARQHHGQPHNSLRAGSAISWRPTPPTPTGRPKKHSSFSPSTAVSSDADQAFRSSNPDCGKTRSAAYRCSQTPPLTVELRLASVAWVLTTYFLQSSSYPNTDTIHEQVCWSDAY